MSLILHDKGWKSFGDGRIWRCTEAGSWLLETDREGNADSYFKLSPTVNKIRRIHGFYDGRLTFGQLGANGNGLDLITANAMTESLGSVPSQVKYEDMLACFQQSPGRTTGDKLNDVVLYLVQHEKLLVRREPGYINPVQTPSRVSFGAHHMLISTALEFCGTLTGSAKEAKIVELALKLSADALFAAEMAVKYLNRSFSRHQNEPPLVAATYNAGSPRPDPSNAWNLKQYGDHIGRWTAFYNTSRMVRRAVAPVALPSPAPVVSTITVPVVSTSPPSGKNLEIKVVRNTFTGKSTIGDLFIDEVFHCHTLEDVVRSGPKVAGKTAIPAGRYQVVMSHSNRFKKIMPEVLSVVGFTGVRIHKGNTAENTEGCLLVGMQKNTDWIGNCTPAYDKLAERINATVPGGKVFLTVG
jgi:hypothetical protein